MKDFSDYFSDNSEDGGRMVKPRSRKKKSNIGGLLMEYGGLLSGSKSVKKRSGSKSVKRSGSKSILGGKAKSTRKPSKYNMFVKKMMPKIVKSYPNMLQKDRMRIVADLWADSKLRNL